MSKKVLLVLALCFALTVSTLGGDTNNPGIEPDPSPTPTPEMSQQSAPDTSLTDTLVTTFAPFIPSLFN